MKGKSLQDGVQFVGDLFGGNKSLKESFLYNYFIFSLLGTGNNNAFVNLNINDLGLLDDDLLFTGDWLNNNFLVSRGNLDVSLDLGDITEGWFVDEKSTVDFVQKVFVVVDVGSIGLVFHWVLLVL